MQLYENPRERPASFALPGENSSFLERITEAAPGVVDMITAPLGNPNLAIRTARASSELYDLVWAAERETLLSRTVTSRQVSLEEAADAQIRKLSEATGVQLENPFRDGYYREARDRVLAALRARGEFNPNALLQHTGELEAEQRNLFNEKMEELLARFPDKAESLRPAQTFEQTAGASATQAENAANAARTKAENADAPWAARFGAELVGGIMGSRRDPLFIASLFAGPYSAIGKTAGSRIVYSAIANGVVNATAQALAQPAVQAWRAERGREYGVLPALEEVGFAFILGMIPGAAVQGVSEALKHPLTRIARGEGSLADAKAAAEALGVRLDEDTTRALVAADRAAAEETLLLSERPKGVRAEEHADAIAAAIRAEVEPAAPPPAPYRAVPENVTGEAAEKALKESPTAADALAALRDDPQLRASAAASENPEVRAAGVLAEGSDELVQDVLNGRVSPRAARAALDAGVPELDQVTVARRIEDARLETEAEMRALAANEIREAYPRAVRTDPMPRLPEGVEVVGEGLNGPVLRGFAGRFLDAVNWLRRAGSGDALEVLELPARPGERIDLIAGREGPDGYGVRHIDSQHPGDLDKLPTLWPRLAIRDEGPSRIVLESAEARAVVVKNFAGAEKRWLLTFFERKGDRSGSGPIEVAADQGPALRSPDRPARTDVSPTAPARNMDPADPLNLVPVTRDDGTTVLVSRDAVEQAGARSEYLSDLVRACKE